MMMMMKIENGINLWSPVMSPTILIMIMIFLILISGHDLSPRGSGAFVAWVVLLFPLVVVVVVIVVSEGSMNQPLDQTLHCMFQLSEIETELIESRVSACLFCVYVARVCASITMRERERERERESLKWERERGNKWVGWIKTTTVWWWTRPHFFIYFSLPTGSVVLWIMDIHIGSHIYTTYVSLVSELSEKKKGTPLKMLLFNQESDNYLYLININYGFTLYILCISKNWIRIFFKMRMILK